MTCYSILVGLPPCDPRSKSYILNEKRLHVLLHSRVPYSLHRSSDEFDRFEIHLCAEDAAQFLQDLPHPLFVIQIQYLYSPHSLLFSNRFVTSKYPEVKPQSKIEKDVFWAAKATERWTPRTGKIEKHYLV